MTPARAVQVSLWLALVAVTRPVHAEIRVLGVTTAAAFAPGMPLPGSLGSIFCTGLVGSTGVRVAFATGDAPILAIAELGGYQQINFQVPWDASGPATVIQGNERAAVPSYQAAWGQFFTAEDGWVVAQHASDYTPVTAASPARGGEWIIVYGTNFSTFDPKWNWNIWMSRGGTQYRLSTNYMGLAPGLPGVYQFNLLMPQAETTGEARFYIEGTRDCGFFFNPDCGRGILRLTSATAKLRFE